MNYSLSIAAEKDAPAIAALHNSAAERLTETFGQGWWSGNLTEKGVLFGMRRGTIFITRDGQRIIGTMTLSARKPWAIDPAYFAQSSKPVYITGMAVAPELQRTGIGRALLDQAKVITVKNGGDTLRLDAWDAAAGAGPFYAKCGFMEVGRVTYRGAKLIYYEFKFAPAPEAT